MKDTVTAFLEKIYKHYYVLPLLGVISLLLFFRYSIVLTSDSAEYLSFLPVIDGSVALENWDGSITQLYPYFLWLIVNTLGASEIAMLSIHFIVYLFTLFFYYHIAIAAMKLESTKQKSTTAIIIYIVIGLNPLVFGYYHVMLTEYLASFFVAVVIYSAIVYYNCLNNVSVSWHYFLSGAFLILSAPILFALRRNYLMMTIGAVLAVLVLAIAQNRSRKKVLRALALPAVAVTALAAGVAILGFMLPEFTFEKITEDINARMTDETPKKGVVDSYFAGINLYGTESIDGISHNIVRDVSLSRANENEIIGFNIFSPFSHIDSLPPFLLSYAEPFISTGATDTLPSPILNILRPVSFSFTVGLLLLPLFWLGSIVLVCVRKKELAFSASFICASVSFGYLLLNSVFRIITDRYNFPVYVSAWMAVFCMAYGIYRITVNRKLAFAETYRSDFASSFSHEINNPIASIGGFAKLLKDGDLSDDEKKEYLELIIAESQRLTELSTNVLNISNAEAIKTIPEKEPFRLDEQIRRAVILTEPKWSAGNMDIYAKMDEVMFNGNEDIVQQIWTNLIDNAVKFSPENREIEIGLSDNGDSIQFFIRDEGIGMDEETKSHIFDMYYRGEEASAMPGHGVGLAIVKRIVELHDGTITVESSPGSGSTFHITFPG